MAADPSIASGALKKLLEVAPELGADPAAACREAGFDPATCDNPDARVPLPVLHALWEAVLRPTGMPDAALRGAQHYSPGDYSLVGFVCMNCATLGEAVRHMVRFVRLWTDEPGMTLEDDGRIQVLFRTQFPDRLGVRMTIEATLAEVLNSARLVTQRVDLAPLSVSFRHAAPADTTAHRRFFGCEVSFGAKADAMRLSPEQMVLTLPKADPQLGEYLSRIASEALAKRADAEPMHERMRAIIAEELQKGVPSLTAIARRMSMSERTLRRRLEEYETSFRELLDETRAELARAYVRDRRLPLSEVAFLLGFSEPSSFHRAFKRWTDTTPAVFREKGPQGPQA